MWFKSYFRSLQITKVEIHFHLWNHFHTATPLPSRLCPALKTICQDLWHYLRKYFRDNSQIQSNFLQFVGLDVLLKNFLSHFQLFDFKSLFLIKHSQLKLDHVALKAATWLHSLAPNYLRCLFAFLQNWSLLETQGAIFPPAVSMLLEDLHFWLNPCTFDKT